MCESGLVKKRYFHAGNTEAVVVGMQPTSPALSWDLGMHPWRTVTLLFTQKLGVPGKNGQQASPTPVLLPQEARGQWRWAVPLGTTPATPTAGGKSMKEILGITGREKWILAAGTHRCPAVSSECQTYGSGSLSSHSAGHRRIFVQKRQVPTPVSKTEFQLKGHKVLHLELLGFMLKS